MRKVSLAQLKSINNYRGRYALLIGVVIVGLILIIFLAGSPPSPIPKSVSSAVEFPVYYPDPSRLPAGYTLNIPSIEVVKPGVAILNVSISGSKQAIVFSEEVRPSASTINSFLADYIPLHTSFNSPVGAASVGAYNDGNALRTVISLPITDGPWIIATAPSNISNPIFESIVDTLIKN